MLVSYRIIVYSRVPISVTLFFYEPHVKVVVVFFPLQNDDNVLVLNKPFVKAVILMSKISNSIYSRFYYEYYLFRIRDQREFNLNLISGIK